MQSGAGKDQAVIVAVPARLASSRLPGKVMADIGGKPMLRHVLERCARARGVSSVLACTDSEAVRDAVRSWGFEGLLTPASCSSGSERLACVVDTLVAIGGASPERTLVVNVQGDQPILDSALIEAMAARMVDLGWPPVITPVHPLPPERIHNPNVVKVLLAGDGRAITFSRSALPHVRDLPPEQWHNRTTYWGHVGISGYRADLLAGWNDLSPSTLEDVEKLEQLRLIEAGIPFATFNVDTECFSVDTAEQLEQARQRLQVL
jgi:3-deoxy-manno-octulosonate cytidylyltransferase (CMP-KDO synthetase)